MKLGDQFVRVVRQKARFLSIHQRQRNKRFSLAMESVILTTGPLFKSCLRHGLLDDLMEVKKMG